jgi:hypothetical protein
MTDVPNRAAGDVERYEQLRGQALAGGPSGFRLGLALLERRGVAAWTRAWQSTTPAALRQRTGGAVEPSGDARQLIDALAAIALASAG